jgi:hypothetical protein
VPVLTGVHGPARATPGGLRALIDTALPDLAGTVTVTVTGASGGIGAGTARRFRCGGSRGRARHAGQDLVVDGGMSVVPAW